MTMRGLPSKPLAIYLIAGFVLGGFAGAFLAHRQPEVFLAEAIIESPDHSNHEERITLLRARMVERELELGIRWGIPPEEAAAKVRQAVTLSPHQPQGVHIAVRNDDPRHARDIARCVAAGLDSPLREQEMAARNPEVGFDPGQMEALEKKIHYLSWQLDNRASRAGFESFDELKESDETGRARAREVMAEEATINWSRELALANKEKDRISRDLASFNPPGEPFKPANSAARIGPFPDIPVSPNVELWVHCGRFGGALVAFVVILGVNRWKPSWLRPPPRLPEPVPDWADGTRTKEDPW